MDLGLRGKVALIAAASKGLGYGVARAMAGEGAKISLCSRDLAGAEAAAAKIAAETGVEVLATACDVKDGKAIQAWIDKTAGKWGQIDALLVNGGGPPAGYFKEFEDKAWMDAFESMILAAVRMIRGTLPHMKPGSAILTVTSSSVREPIERLGLSTVMRAGVTGLVKTLADELAPDGIRINNLMPGRIDTDRIKQLDTITSAKTGTPIETVRAQNAAKIPLKRLGTIEEFGAAGAFLLSPAAAYITGDSLRVDGGLMRSI